MLAGLQSWVCRIMDGGPEMTSQVLSSIVLILACFLVYQVAIRSGTLRHPGDRNTRE
jgi:hypothetical protein